MIYNIYVGELLLCRLYAHSPQAAVQHGRGWLMENDPERLGCFDGLACKWRAVPCKT